MSGGINGRPPRRVGPVDLDAWAQFDRADWTERWLRCHLRRAFSAVSASVPGTRFVFRPSPTAHHADQNQNHVGHYVHY